MSGKTERMNLYGVKCPLNWAKAKVRLEDLERGDVLEVLINDPKGRRDIPRAAEAEGYAVVTIDEIDGGWRIAIEK
ncbi:MAG TPA: sulfurtransferase TusA family protein [Methylomirabilota bacterium]|jgi:tRNA 2-thiouridine synthesizing protein A|nr:sulfurtransferase TusA family protein [Methylomirabilota bacterium]